MTSERRRRISVARYGRWGLAPFASRPLPVPMARVLFGGMLVHFSDNAPSHDGRTMLYPAAESHATSVSP